MKKEWFVPREWRLAHGKSLILGERSHIMGILNMTPDSFSDGGLYEDLSSALSQVELLCSGGATIIDIGGESTRPGAIAIDSETECNRILPLVRALSDRDIIISVDTYHPQTALAAIESGAHIINDIWGCRKSPEIADIASRTQCGLVVMHNNRSLSDDTVEAKGKDTDILSDQKTIFSESLSILESHNIGSSQYVLDPGFGFGKDGEYNLGLLSILDSLHNLGGSGLLIGTSRKRFLGTLLGCESSNRDIATSATSIYARLHGASILRVHDCHKTRDALCVADALIRQELRRLP